MVYWCRLVSIQRFLSTNSKELKHASSSNSKQLKHASSFQKVREYIQKVRGKPAIPLNMHQASRHQNTSLKSFYEHPRPTGKHHHQLYQLTTYISVPLIDKNKNQKARDDITESARLRVRFRRTYPVVKFAELDGSPCSWHVNPEQEL